MCIRDSYGIEYVDQVLGNYFPEAIVPTLFHTDPRYFRKGTGSVSSRLIYALDRIIVCKNNNGNTTFNVNEFVGNPLAAVAASSYHPHEKMCIRDRSPYEPLHSHHGRQRYGVIEMAKGGRQGAHPLRHYVIARELELTRGC